VAEAGGDSRGGVRVAVRFVWKLRGTDVERRDEVMSVDAAALSAAFSRALRRRFGAVPTQTLNALGAVLAEALRELAAGESAKAAEASLVTFVGEADPVHWRAVELLADVGEPATEPNYVDAVEVASERKSAEVADDPLARRLAAADAVDRVARDRLGDNFDADEYMAMFTSVGREVGLDHYDHAG